MLTGLEFTLVKYQFVKAHHDLWAVVEEIKVTPDQT